MKKRGKHNKKRGILKGYPVAINRCYARNDGRYS